MATPQNPRSRAPASGGRTTGASSRRPTRAASASSNQMPMILGGVGVLVVVVVVAMMNSGGSKAAETAPATPAPASATPPASQPASAPAPVQLASAKAGKPPSRPAPPLTQAMLDQVRSLTAAAGVLFNEGVKARTDGNNTLARDKQAQAKDTLDKVQVLLKDQLLWQEEAQMEEWAQPAEYITLEREYGATMTLTKKIRMQGGK